MVGRRVVISFLLVAFVAQGSAAPTDDECDIHALDNCAADLFVFSTRNTLPETESDLATFCKLQLDAVACGRAYIEKCTSGPARGWSDIFLDNVKGEIEKRCKTSFRYHNESIKHAPCLNKVGSLLNTCMKNTIVDLDVASRLPQEHRIAGACCKYNKLARCVRKAVEPTCPTEALVFIEDVLSRYDFYLLGDVCASYGPGDKCNGIQYDDKPGDASLRSVLTPLIRIFAALYVYR
ncbi:uncharacterized protein LOC119458189 [Dermacentor silvarum]|uniref:uncharacterized protein LOC119458189 n=1 Tax=Dermacentor silvarum TaxID=543639 RepID=UPI00189C1080|nr:uncharacterized protein LOC119458189 [Dermacentor silvarum]